MNCLSFFSAPMPEVTANRPMWSAMPLDFGAMKSARQRLGRVTPSTTGRTLCMRRPRQVISTSLRVSSV